MKNNIFLLVLLLCSACASPPPPKPDALYVAPPWPEPVNVKKQSGVAKYIVRAHSSYQSCKTNLDVLKSLDHTQKK